MENTETQGARCERSLPTKYLADQIWKDEFASRRVEIWRRIAEQQPIDLLVISASAHPQHIVSGYIAPKSAFNKAP
jgi:hypothetical protein